MWGNMQLYEHQKNAVAWLLNRQSGAVFYDIGLGKTLVALKYYETLKLSQPDLKMLVICPLSLIEAAWKDDITRFTKYSYANLHNKLVFNNEDINVINYEFTTSPTKVEALKEWCRASDVLCVLDESSRVKNHKSKTAKVIMGMRELFDIRVVMSATPAPNDPTEYFTQMEFVKPDILGGNFFKFRNSYFVLERNGTQIIGQGHSFNRAAMQQMFRQGFKYKMVKSNQFWNTIGPYLIRAKRSECLDLPSEINETRYVYLSKELRKKYSEMKNQLITELRGKTVSVQHAITKLMKLRQLTSGFLISENGEVIDSGANPKLKELKSLVEEIGSEQAIIWATFQHEIRSIKEMLGDKAVCLYGETKDKNEPISLFKSGHARYLIAHGRSCGHGVTLTNCAIQIFYSLDFSWEIHEQSRGRNMRISQTRNCTYIYLLAKNTIDEYILKVLKSKGSAQNVLEEVINENFKD